MSPVLSIVTFSSLSYAVDTLNSGQLDLASGDPATTASTLITATLLGYGAARAGALGLNELRLVLSSSGSSLTSWLTPRQGYKKSREDPEIGFVMGWHTHHHPQDNFF